MNNTDVEKVRGRTCRRSTVEVSQSVKRSETLKLELNYKTMGAGNSLERLKVGNVL